MARVQLLQGTLDMLILRTLSSVPPTDIRSPNTSNPPPTNFFNSSVEPRRRNRRLVASQLYSGSPHDPAYFLVAALILFACIVASACTPALRAARVDPLTALRYE